MQAIYVPPKLCRYSKLEAAQGYWKACADVGLTPSISLISVLVAHGALESGNFQKGCWNNNPGNIKAGLSYRGKYTCITLNEVLLNARTGKYEERWFAPAGELTASPSRGGVFKGAPLPVPPGHAQTRMRSYDTLDDGLEDKIRFFMKQHQPAIAAAQAGDPGRFVREIRARKYFTAYAHIPLDKVTPYETAVCSLTKTYLPYVQQVAVLVQKGIAPPPAPVLRIAEVDPGPADRKSVV